MRIKWYGTASLLVESGESRILIDPYLKEHAKNRPPFDREDGKDVDAILITHPHFDHFKDISFFMEGVPVHVSPNGLKQAEKNYISTDSMVPMSANETIKIGNLTVKTYASRHCVFDLATILRVAFSPRTYFGCFRAGISLIRDAYHFRCYDDIYAFEISDGEKRIVVLGSAGYLEEVDYPKDCDLLVFPFQGRSRMHRYLIRFLDVFRPKGVLIDHFDDAFPPFTHTMNIKKFAPILQKHLPGARAIVPEEGVFYEV